MEKEGKKQPTAREVVQPKEEKRGSWRDGLRRALGGMGYEGGRSALSLLKGPKPTEEQMEALQTVHALLEPDKLGGADRTFDFADRQAIVQALMSDTCGLSQEVQKQLLAEGKGFQARVARRGLAGRRGPLANMARKRVYREAPGQIGGELTQGLVDAGIAPKTGEEADSLGRTLTFDELRQFQEAALVLEQLRAEVAKKFGFDVDFPGGISQASIAHTMEGRIGVPPGGKISRPRQEPVAHDFSTHRIDNSVAP